jgi:beta-galactosidase
LLSPVLGIRTEEYSALGSDTWYTVKGIASLDGTYTAIHYVDWVTPDGSETVAGYADQWHMKPFSAVTRNGYGKGKGWYVGTIIKEESFYDSLIAELLEDAGIRPLVNPPNGVEVSIRQGHGRKLIFLMNHTQQSKIVDVPEGRIEMLSNTRTKKTLKLDRFDVAVVLLE